MENRLKCWNIFFHCSYQVLVSDLISHMTTRTIFVSCVAVLIISQMIVGLRALKINRDNTGLLSVPQDLDPSVTTLSLERNHIIVIGNSSFLQYRSLKVLSLSVNPLQEIQFGSFDNNPELEVFECMSCHLYRFPVDFGPASNSLKTIWFHWGIRNSASFRQMRLDHFTSLRSISPRGLRGVELDSLKLPVSLTYLDLRKMHLVTFPNLSVVRFPHLSRLNAQANRFQQGSNFWGVTKSIGSIAIDSSNLYTADGLELLQNLYRLEIKSNKLETIPDLLGLRKLKRLLMKGNSRMNCDKRICWRRLWDRVRHRLQISDDVVCVEPPLLAGHSLSKVNPKFMQCSNGKLKNNI